ncbi:MAG: S41 family peptidase [Planctomycetota bacterium]|nr:MAG: S41 family peptidase [Planctomycetota bacterium]
MSRGPRRLWSGSWLLAATLIGLGWSVAASAQPSSVQPASAQPLWAPIAPEPADIGGIAVSVPHEDLAARTTALVHEGRWADVVGICETAARKGTLAPSLRQQYDLAKLHCDVARRHAEPAFRGQLLSLSETDARRVYGEVLARIGSHHVENPDYARLLSRGLRAIDVALEEPAFAAAHAAQVTPERRSVYREHVAQIAGSRGVSTQEDAETMAAWVARAAHSILGIPPAVTLIEMSAAAVGGLDEYSAFLTTGQLDDLYSQIEGNFVGLGVELKSAADGLLVVHVIPASPAARAGVRAGDHLVGVGGRSIGGLSVDEAAHLLQGPEGSLVTLAILRAPAPARAVTVRREHVEVPSIEDVRMLDTTAGIAALKLSSFQKTTAADLEAALRRLDAAGMRSLVIDLRGNPGGLLSAAVDVADLFLERGLVVATRGRSPDEDFNYSAGRPGTWRMPLVVVIDGDSASSSEIFAGAIRDHARGTIVGSRSYGKGSVQGIFPLDAAGVGMRLTTAKFFSPKGLPYSGVGVEPDVPVHTVARPVDGVIAGGSADTALAAATDVARRATLRPAARPSGRSTAAR